MKTISQKLKRENKQLLFPTGLLLLMFLNFLTIIEIILIITIFWLVAVIAARNFLRYTHSKPINEETLSELKSFGQEEDGSFSDRMEFKITPRYNAMERVEWYLEHFDEVDGSTYPIKRLRSLNDLKRVYEVLTDKELI
ncbi:MAG: hypothetical protein ACOC22_01195 [bacterium]